MASSLSNLECCWRCKYGHNAQKCKTCGIKFKDCDCFLKYTNVKDNLIGYKCLCNNKNYEKIWWKPKEEIF